MPLRDSGQLNSEKRIRLNSKANDCAPERKRYSPIPGWKIESSSGSKMCWKIAASSSSQTPLSANLLINNHRIKMHYRAFF